MEQENAELRRQLAEGRSGAKRVKFLVALIILTVAVGLSSMYLPTQGFLAVTAFVLLLILALAHHWEFTQMVPPVGGLLERFSGRPQAEEPEPSPDEQPPP